MVLPSHSNNVLITTFTIAHACYRLYECLEKVKKGELGGDTIQEFVAAGSKYCVPDQNTLKKKTVLRVKGMSRTCDACASVNFDSVKNLGKGFLGGSPDEEFYALQQNITCKQSTI